MRIQVSLALGLLFASGCGGWPAVCIMGRCGMVEVPEGEFQMGTMDIMTPQEYQPIPVHRQRVARFFLDQTEVTVAAYQEYCNAAKGCVPPATTVGCNWGVAGAGAAPGQLRELGPGRRLLRLEG